MMKYLDDNKKENIVLENLTPAQRFFINYARIRRCNTRKEEILNRIITDPHSPPVFRVNGVVVKLDEFYKAVDVNETDKIWKPKNERITIW